MSRRRRIQFEGLLQRNVLGTFTVIRGFADMADLAEVSIAIPFRGAGLADGTGYQRDLDEAHVEGLKRYLQTGRYRFFPEIVLSLRSKGEEDRIVSYRKRRKAPNDATYLISVDVASIQATGGQPIRRIDGNHRLEASKRLAEDQTRSARFKDFGTAPFCFVVLDSDQPKDDDIAEAMLFNLINSKALPIVSEHSLSVLMTDEGTQAERFEEDPQVYLTRWIRDRVRTWPAGFYDAMGQTPLTRLHATASVLFTAEALAGKERDKIELEANQLFDPLYDLATRLRTEHEPFVLSRAFLPVAAEVYLLNTIVEGSASNAKQARLLRAERWLREFARWFQRIGGTDLPLSDASLLWAVFKKEFDKKAKSVFIAMSFQKSQTLTSVKKAINEALDRFNADHPNTKLAPRRVDEQKGSSYDIPGWVFNEIDQSGLVIADLTDERPNVYCEVGYAKSRGIPFILTFHQKVGDKAPWDRKRYGGNRVHFDLAALRHIAYSDSLDLRDRLKEELDALFEEGN